MKKKSLLLPLLTICIFVSGCHHETLQKLAPDESIMAFGDSLTYGYGSESNQGWPVILQNLSHHHVVNEGVNGDTTDSGKQRLEQALDDNHPSLVILSLGGNDLLRHDDKNQAINNLKSMIDIIQSKGIQVALLAEPQPQLSFRLHDADFYESIAHEKKIVIIKDVYSSLLSHQENKSDVIHLNDKGYQQAAQKINEQLIKAGAF